MMVKFFAVAHVWVSSAYLLKFMIITKVYQVTQGLGVDAASCLIAYFYCLQMVI